MKNLEFITSELKNEMKMHVSDKQQFDTWINILKPLNLYNNILYLEIPKQDTLFIFEGIWKPKLKEALNNIAEKIGGKLDVEVIAKDSKDYAKILTLGKEYDKDGQMRKSLTKSAKTVEEAVRLALDEIGKKRSEVTIDVLDEGSGGFLGLIGGKDAVVKVSYDEDMDRVLENLKNEIEVDSLREVEKSYDVKKRSEEIKKEEGILDESENPIKEESEDLGDKIKDKANEIEDLIEEKSEEIFAKDSKEETQETKEIEENSEIDQQEAERKDYALSKKRSNIDNYYKAKELLEQILKAMHFENVSVIGNLEGSIIKLEAKVDENDTGIAIGKGGASLDAIEFIIRKAIDSRSNNLRVNIDINNYKRRRDDKIVRLARDTAQKVAQSGKSWNLRYMNSYERRLAHEEISKHRNVSSHSEGREPQRYVVVDYVEE